MTDISFTNNRFSRYLSGLFVFQLVAQHGNFTGAAESLGLTQSSISQRIKQLESDLGISLFARKSRGVELTNDGIRLLSVVTPAMGQIQNAVARLLEGKLKPRVRISADFAFSTFWLLPQLSQLRSELNDEVEIQILASQVPPQAGTDDCDISIHVSETSGIKKQDKLLLEEKVVGVCSPDYLKKHGPFSSSDELLKTQLISLSRPPSAKWQTWQGWFASLGINDDRSRNYISFNNYDMVIQAAIAGEGVALGWLGLVDNLLEQGVLVQTTEDVVTSDAGYVMSLDPRNTRSGSSQIFNWIADKVNAQAH